MQVTDLPIIKPKFGLLLIIVIGTLISLEGLEIFI